MEERNSKRNKDIYQLEIYLKRFLNGLLEHPKALDGIQERATISQIRSWEKKAIEFEAKREKLLDKLYKLNAKEADFWDKIKDDLKYLRDVIRGKYSNKPEIVKDFVDERNV